jgi:hypothetical protein
MCPLSHDSYPTPYGVGVEVKNLSIITSENNMV